MALTGANVPLAKIIVAHVPVTAFLVFRFAVSTAALVLLARREAGPRLSSTTPAQMRDLFAMSLFGMVGYTILIFEGVRRTSAADAGIIAATLPAVVAVLSLPLSTDRMRWGQWASVALAVAGVLLVQAGAAGGGVSSLVGNALVAGAVLCEAAFVIIGKRLAPPFGPLRLALGANVVGLVLSLPLLGLEAQAFDAAALTPLQWLQAVWYVLSASVLCLWLWYRGLPHLPTWLAGVATSALPVAALALSAVLLDESIGPARLAGAALVVAGIALGAAAARNRP